MIGVLKLNEKHKKKKSSIETKKKKGRRENSAQLKKRRENFWLKKKKRKVYNVKGFQIRYNMYNSINRSIKRPMHQCEIGS